MSRFLTISLEAAAAFISASARLSLTEVMSKCPPVELSLRSPVMLRLDSGHELFLWPTLYFYLDIPLVTEAAGDTADIWPRWVPLRYWGLQLVLLLARVLCWRWSRCSVRLPAATHWRQAKLPLGSRQCSVLTRAANEGSWRFHKLMRQQKYHNWQGAINICAEQTQIFASQFHGTYYGVTPV